MCYLWRCGVRASLHPSVGSTYTQDEGRDRPTHSSHPNEEDDPGFKPSWAELEKTWLRMQTSGQKIKAANGSTAQMSITARTNSTQPTTGSVFPPNPPPMFSDKLTAAASSQIARLSLQKRDIRSLQSPIGTHFCNQLRPQVSLDQHISLLTGSLRNTVERI